MSKFRVSGKGFDRTWMNLFSAIISEINQFNNECRHTHTQIANICFYMFVSSCALAFVQVSVRIHLHTLLDLPRTKDVCLNNNHMKCVSRLSFFVLCLWPFKGWRLLRMEVESQWKKQLNGKQSSEPFHISFPIFPSLPDSSPCARGHFITNPNNALKENSLKWPLIYVYIYLYNIIKIYIYELRTKFSTWRRDNSK